MVIFFGMVLPVYAISDSECKKVEGSCLPVATCDAPYTSAGSCENSSVDTPLTCCTQKDISNSSAGKNAQTAAVGMGTPVEIRDPLGNIGLLAIMGRIVKAFIGLAGSIAFLAFVYAGVTYLISAGDEKQVAKAKATMVNATIGLILILMAYKFTDFVLSLFDV